MTEETITRAEHVRWAKERSRQYLERGDLQNAVASMVSDMNKDPRTALDGPLGALLGADALRMVMAGDRAGIARWIEGFAE